MAPADEMTKIADTVSSAKKAIESKNETYQSAASTKCWNGDIANSFKNANARARSKIRTLLNTYSALESSLKNLGSAVGRAEQAKVEQAKAK